MNEEMMRMVRSNPQVQQVIQQAVAEMMQDPDVTPDSVAQLIRMFEFVLQDPNSYADFRASAIQSGVLDEEDLPPDFQPELLMAILMALKLVEQHLGQAQQQQQFARGGLAQLAMAGRNGDTRLAHINPFEARLLNAYGGSGRINPATGLPEYGLWKSLKKVFKAIAPIIPFALDFFIPGAGTMLGSFLSGGALAGTGAAMLGNAVIGGLSSKLAGGSGTQGALMGALGSGFGNVVGETASKALGLNLGSTGQALLGSGITGALGGIAGGQGAVKGAIQGALGNFLGSQVQGMGGTGAVGQGVNTAGRMFGNMMASGYSPQQSATVAGLAGLAQGLMAKPSSSVVSQMKGGDSTGLGLKLGTTGEGLQAPDSFAGQLSREGITNYLTGETGTIPGQAPQLVADSAAVPGMDGALGTGLSPGASAIPTDLPAIQGAPVTPSDGLLSNITPLKAIAGLTLLGGLQGAPQPVVQAVQTLSPAQQEYFNRPTLYWDWDKIQSDAAAQNKNLGLYVAENWPDITSGRYNVPAPVNKARGGALNRVAMLARGAGSGRADTIDARLSDGEYVMDAETVALLGDGSTEEGARRLDDMRSRLRAHKGKSLAKGKFSPNARSPLAYMKEAA